MHSTGTSIVLFFLCTINHSYYLVLTGKWKGVSWKIGVCVNVRTSCYAVPEMLIHIGWISIDFLQQPQHTRLQRNTNAQPWSQMRASLPWKIKLYNKKQSNAWPYAYCTKNQLKAGEASISTTIIQKCYWHYPLYKYLIFSYTWLKYSLWRKEEE